MIDVIVSLNDEDFPVLVAGDVYDNDLPDYNAAVHAARVAYRLKFPLDPIEPATLVVRVERVYTDVATRDGAGTTNDHPKAQPSPTEDPDRLTDEELEEATAPDQEFVEDYQGDPEVVNEDAVNEDGAED